MPKTPEERRKTFESLARMRQQMIDDERAKQSERERAADETVARQKAESLAEQQAAMRRGGERETWRQEQHTKHEEELEASRLAAEDRVRQEAKATKALEEQKERDAHMYDLHDRAVGQKTAARKLQAEHIEEETAAYIETQSERDLRDLQRVLDRTLEHLTQDRRKKIEHLETDADRQGASLTNKRALLMLRERTAEAKAAIETEYARLRDEAVARADQQKSRLRRVADQRLREARTRHEHADEWTDAHRG